MRALPRLSMRSNGPSSVEPVRGIRLRTWKNLAAVLSIVAVSSCIFNVVDPLAPSLRGSVQSATGGPVKDAQISLPRHGLVATTDIDGNFAFESLPREELDLRIKAAQTSAVTLDALDINQDYDLAVGIDANGEVSTLALRVRPRSAGGTSFAQTFHALSRPQNAVDSKARSSIDGDVYLDGDQELALDMDELRPGLLYDIYLQNSDGSQTLSKIGLVRADANGWADFEYGDDDINAYQKFAVAGADKNSLFERKIEVRDKKNAQTILQGLTVLTRNGRSKGRNGLLKTSDAPEAAAGFVRIRNTPPGQQTPPKERDGDTFDVFVRGLEPETEYEICLECPSGSTNKSTTLPAPSTTGCDPSTATMGPASVSGSTVNIPIFVCTTDPLVAAKFSVDFNSACVTFDGAVAGTATAGANFRIPTPFVTIGSPSTVAVLVEALNPALPFGPGNALHVATMRFQRVLPSTLPECHFDWNSNTSLANLAGIEFNPVLLPPGGITVTFLNCLDPIVTNDEGAGKLKIKQHKGDQLPCGVARVAELEGVRLVVQEVASGVAVLEGTVPALVP